MLVEPEAAQIASVVEHLNDEHADTILLVAQFVGDRRGAVDARIIAAGPAGLRLAVRAPDAGSEVVRVGFAGRPRTVAEARDELYRLIGRARGVAGDAQPTTTLEADIAATANLQTFATSVVATDDVTTIIRQITVRGGLEGSPRSGGVSSCSSSCPDRPATRSVRT